MSGGGGHPRLHTQSIVSYVGIAESGHCGYCKSARRAHKVNFGSAAGGPREGSSSSLLSGGADLKLANQQKCLLPTSSSSNAQQEEEADNEPNSVVFGLIAHCLCLDTFNQLLDMGWSLWANRLTVQAYQGLVDRGWRRSGCYLYKPLMERTCCPQYTIRLDVHKFRLSRTQKRVLRAMRDFLRADKRPRAQAVVREEDDGQRKKAKKVVKMGDEERREEQSGRNINNVEKERLPKKKVLRRQRAEKRLKARGIDLEQYKLDRAAREEGRRRTLHSFFDGYNAADWAHKFELRLVAQPSPEFEADFGEEFQLFRRYQIQIHCETAAEQSPEAFRRFLASSPLTYASKSADEESAVDEDDDADFDGDGEEMDGEAEGKKRTSASSSRQVQRAVLLASSSPSASSSSTGNTTTRLGSYHQQYWLDGRIIAVAVIDLLPRCLSAKYFFYDPDYAFLSLGTYSALREIAFTQQLAVQRPDLHFYYMGFYLLGCPKMRYKGKFWPSELLCDHCFKWVPLDECHAIIEAAGGRFSTFHAGIEPLRRELSQPYVDTILCLYGQRKLVPFGQLAAAVAEQQEAAGGDDDDDGHGTGTLSSSTTTTSASAKHAFTETELLMSQLREKMRLFVHHAGPVALKMILVL